MPQALLFLPGVPLIAGEIGSALFAVGVPTAIINALPAVLLNVAISAGLSAASGLLTKPSPGSTPSQAQQQIRQPVAERRRSVGIVRVSGAVWWYATSPSLPYRLFVGVALNHGRIGGYLNYYLDSNPATAIDTTDGSVDGSPYGDSTAHGFSTATLLSRVGLPTETAYDLSDFAVDNIRGDGVATILGVFNSYQNSESQFNVYPNGVPVIRATIQGTVCFDPRIPAHSVADPSTWAWSENPIVCLLNYLIDDDGYGIDYSRISGNLAEWMAAADICDEAVTLAFSGGREKRYRCSGSFGLSEAPKDVVQRFLDCCDGRLWVRRDGTLGIVAGRVTPPSVIIASRDIVGYSELQHGQDPFTAVAGVRAQFLSPDSDFRETEAEAWPSAAEIAGLGDDRVGALDLSWVPSQAQARRLMKRAYVHANAAWRGTVHTNLAGLRAIDERYIRLMIDELSLDQTFEVTRFSVDPGSLTCQLDVMAVDVSIDDWDAATEESPAGAGAVAFGRVGPGTGNIGIQTLDPIADLGGQRGQLAIVGACIDSGSLVTPSGWTAIDTSGPSGGLGAGVWWRILDGSEGPTAFVSGTGNIAGMLVNGVPAPAFTDLNSSLSASAISTTTKQVVGPPYGVIGFAACSTSVSAYGIFSSGSQLSPGARVTLQDGSANITLSMMSLFYGPGDVPEDLFFQAPDNGQNYLCSFVLQPGTLP